ncbi:hypothetical protein QJQ45_011471 [Haematococcus lacustris]|nr:hypothetical protein QJQ45_011471 [Haematococcus lacustris]
MNLQALPTIMLIPGKKGISYPKHIDNLRRYPEYCQHLASIPPTKTSCSKPGKHANLHIYVIWNAAGQQLVTNGNPQGWLASTATALHPQRDTHPIRNRPANQSQPATPPSGHKQHMRLPLDRDLPTPGHQRSHSQLTEHSTTQPRMAINEWATLAYTDGSCIKASGAHPTRVGAGVYIPETNVRVTVAMDDPESNTINKAELTAIHAALTAGVKRIATDSLCSIYQIRRALANPMSLITHRHNDILTAIATLITDSPVTIHFYKVRAHSGIIGNEGADALAKHAALHPELANTPAYRPTTRKETNTWLSSETDGDTPAPLPDCRQSVRAHMHRKHSLGLANQDSIYYQMSQEITKAAAKGAGERVMTDTNISTPAQRTALLYRTGGPKKKLAMRWKRATDDRCPLCGEADSATHLLSGCSETLPMVQERHNGAGRLIAKAISKGTLGGCISFADTGSWEKGAKEDLDLPNDTLHTTLRALGLKTAATKHTTRPDILMVMPTTKTGKRGKAIKRVIIIEIKYCSDSRWTDQLDKALNQHTNLAQTIRKEDHMVEIRPILLGIALQLADQPLQPVGRGYTLAQLPSGFLATKLGGSRVLPAGVALWSAATCAVPPLSSTVIGLCIARAAVGLGEAVAPTAAIDMVANAVPAPERSRAVSFIFGGLHVGSILGLLACPWLIHNWGWQSVFFSFGASGLLWAAWFQWLRGSWQRHDPQFAALLQDYGPAAATQAAHSAEQAGRTRSAEAQPTGPAAAGLASQPIPYRAFLRSRPVQALGVTHFCHNFLHYTSIIASATAGPLADWLISRGLPVPRVRKAIQGTSFLAPLALLLLACTEHVVHDRTASVACITAALGLSSFSLAGLYCTPQDLSPKYASALLSMSNTAGALPGVIGVTLVGMLYDATQSWQVALFMPSAVFMVIGAYAYCVHCRNTYIDFDNQGSKRTKAEQAAESTQPTKAAKAKLVPQPGRWLDRDCNVALNIQRIGESRWRPLELCYWPNQGALPAKSKEYPGLGYKRLRDKPPKAQEQQQQPAEAQ